MKACTVARNCVVIVKATASQLYSALFGFAYTEVCGHVLGYKKELLMDSMERITKLKTSTWTVYPSHGKPGSRQHIWSLGLSIAEDLSGGRCCPCNDKAPNTVPKFGKNNWYCESGNPSDDVFYHFFGNDKLWDGQKCSPNEKPCCNSPIMPYFHTNVDGVTSDSIELRICHDSGLDDEDVPLQSYQFFVR